MNLDELVERVKGHTVGDWELCAHLARPEIDAGCPCIASKRGTIWSADGEQIVCEIGETPDLQAGADWTPPFPREVSRANAALIAAAPSLLTLALEQREKLKHAVTCMDRWCQRCNKLQEEL